MIEEGNITEILSFKMRYYVYIIKLRLQPSKKQVAHGCGCEGLLSCGVAGVATQNRLQVIL